MKYIGNEQLKELVRLIIITLRRLAGLHAAITTTYLLIVHTQTCQSHNAAKCQHNKRR